MLEAADYVVSAVRTQDWGCAPPPLSSSSAP